VVTVLPLVRLLAILLGRGNIRLLCLPPVLLRRPMTVHSERERLLLLLTVPAVLMQLDGTLAGSMKWCLKLFPYTVFQTVFVSTLAPVLRNNRSRS
jgi:hypothetical protein